MKPTGIRSTPIPHPRPSRSEAMQPTPTHHDANDDRAGHAWMTEPLDATIHLAFAFDIGDEIDLDRARLILQGSRASCRGVGETPNRSAIDRPRSA